MSGIVDLNADLGEGCPFDGDLMPLITSANVACGAHAGDEATMLATLRLASEHGVQVGAHPGYPDREHFGRRDLTLPPAEVNRTCTHQIQTLKTLAAGIGVTVVCPMGVATRIRDADRNRPAALRPAADARESDEVTLIGRTLEPEDVAKRTLDAVRAGELYVITHDEALEPLRRRFQRLEEAVGRRPEV